MRFLLDTGSAADRRSDSGADERGGRRRQRAEKAFGIDRNRERVPAQQRRIDIAGEIVLGGDRTGGIAAKRHQRQQGPVTEQRRPDHDDPASTIEVNHGHAREDVRERKPLQHAWKPKRRAGLKGRKAIQSEA